MRRSRALLTVIPAALTTTSPAFADGPLGPTAYAQSSDSPFASTTFSWFHLESFEDGLNTPGLSFSAGVILNPGAETDSVDADDGSVDGLGQAGNSWYLSVNTVTMRFDIAVLGAFPTHAGFVWTDVGTTTSTTGIAPFEYEVFDALGASLGVFGPFTLGDGDFRGQTAEDRFFGFESASGISAITIRSPESSDWEIDHVQYGLIPAPSTAALLLAAAPLIRRRRAV